ncbi:hypothetical protein [Comamonas sp. GB3 AK4-5]|uniref:hypothetical protein n=1 Tax=Comamonas sp. GB3 AK4-5 TaxID=3231487 RepID=UPI00351EE96D
MNISIKRLRSPLMTSNQAAIGGVFIIGFFICWFVYAYFWSDILCAIGGKDNLSGWVQAIGSIFAILGAALFPVIHNKIASDNELSKKEKEAILYLLRIKPILRDFEDDVRTCGYRYVFALDPVGMQENDIVKLFSEFREWLKQYDNFLDDSLPAQSFAIIPELIGQRISYAIGEFKSIQLDVSRFSVDFYEKNNNRFESKLSEWKDGLILIADILRTVNHLVDERVNLDEVLPANEEIYRNC